MFELLHKVLLSRVSQHFTKHLVWVVLLMSHIGKRYESDYNDTLRVLLKSSYCSILAEPYWCKKAVKFTGSREIIST